MPPSSVELMEAAMLVEFIAIRFELRQFFLMTLNQFALSIKIPPFSDLLTFGVQVFFTIAGLLALFYLLTGALSWITSGGIKEHVEKARDRIQAAIVGLCLIVVVLVIISTLEKGTTICFGISCPVTIPSLLPPP